MLKGCIDCNRELPLENFWRHSSRPSGFNDRCKECSRIKDKKYKNKEETKYSRKNRVLKIKYGITLDIYKNILEKQNGKCAICKDLLGTIQVNLDHCHKTKRVRGILCNRCNTLLGNSLDNVEILQNAINYLKQEKI